MARVMAVEDSRWKEEQKKKKNDLNTRFLPFPTTCYFPPEHITTSSKPAPAHIPTVNVQVTYRLAHIVQILDC